MQIMNVPCWVSPIYCHTCHSTLPHVRDPLLAIWRSASFKEAKRRRHATRRLDYETAIDKEWPPGREATDLSMVRPAMDACVSVSWHNTGRFSVGGDKFRRHTDNIQQHIQKNLRALLWQLLVQSTTSSVNKKIVKRTTSLLQRDSHLVVVDVHHGSL
jgi:hypothetical protein